MIRMRRRRLAWIFALVLALELALLCCASIHLADHACLGHERCAICAFVRSGLRRFAIAAPMLSALAVAIAFHLGARASRRAAIADSPILRRVRLND